MTTNGETAVGLWNRDLAPTPPERRTWRWYHYVALWLGMVMCVPAYTLAAGLVGSGMSAYQAVVTVALGNLIVLIPMLLIGHAGAKYGIPYAVLVRCSFGTLGGRFPAMLRALVACGWYGIQTWFGGLMIYTLIGVLLGRPLSGPRIPVLGIDPWQMACFLMFWLMQFYFVVHGIESIRRLETYTAPIKVVICVMLLVWAYRKAGGFGPIVQRPSRLESSGGAARQFYSVFWPSLTAMVGFWSTMALNIPDFTRFARSQRDQLVGQAIGLPAPMGLLAALSVFVTSATVVIYGKAIWNPVTLAGRMTGAAVLVALLVLLVDTISVNLAANLVGPAFDFSSLHPRRISYRTGGYITAVIALVMMPWRILASTHGYVFTWLVGYSALLGAVAGILIVDYYLIRRRVIDVQSLYRAQGSRYHYRRGWNPIAVGAFLAGVLPCAPGFLHACLPRAFPYVNVFFGNLYDYAWFVALGLSAAFYTVGMQAAGQGRSVPALEYARRV
ncbi:MAG: NCS1 family nucleobase:cation symporter-1 [Gammaproteobacteria bacterium]|nr:NCS1 family nucleobase:cation symporter-1 [Gammaproteobacteria bacterium]